WVLEQIPTHVGHVGRQLRHLIDHGLEFLRDEPGTRVVPVHGELVVTAVQIASDVLEREPPHQGVGVCPRIWCAPIDLRTESLQRLLAKLDFAIAYTATPEIIQILVRKTQGGEILESRRRTDALRHLESAASLERLDIGDGL